MNRLGIRTGAWMARKGDDAVLPMIQPLIQPMIQPPIQPRDTAS